MRAGLLRHFIRVEERAEVRGDFGNSEPAWSDRGHVWAQVQPLRGDERFNAQQIKTAADIKVTVRHIDWLTPKMRLVWQGKALDIEDIIDVDGRHRTLELMCKQAE